MEERHAILPDSHWWVQGRLQALRVILRRTVPPGGPALDAGAGSGVWGTVLQREYGPVTLAEPDPDLYERLSGRSAAPERAVRAQLPALPFAEGAFRLVTCLDVLEHTDDDYAAALELRRVLAPGGSLLVTVPAHPHLWSIHDERAGHRRRYTATSLHRLLVSAGLSIRLLSPLNVWLYPAAWTARKLGLRGTQDPGRLAGRLLAALYGSEGNLAGRWPLPLPGLSLVCVAKRS